MKRIAINRRGISTVELALMLSLIAICSILSISAVGDAMRNPLATVSDAFDPSDPSQNASAMQIHSPESPARSDLIYVCVIGIGALAVGLFLLKTPEKKKSATGVTKQAIVDQLQAMISHHDDSTSGSQNTNRKRDDILQALMVNAACHQQTTLTAGEIMTPRICYLTPDTKATKVRKEMKTTGLRHILVCDAGGLRGIISDRDLANQDARTAEQLMTPDPLHIARTDDVADAIDILLTNRISCLPVVEGRKVIGVITVTDLSVTLQCILALYGKLLWTGARD